MRSLSPTRGGGEADKRNYFHRNRRKKGVPNVAKRRVCSYMLHREDKPSFLVCAMTRNHAMLL